MFDIVTQNLLQNYQPWTTRVINEYALGTRGVWSVVRTFSGEAIERYLGHNVPIGFPGIDKWDEATGIATSIKSVDMTLPSYTKDNVETVLNSLKSATLKLDRPTKIDITNFVGAKGQDKFGNKLDVEANQITQKVLQLVIPTEPLTTVQQQAIDAFRAFLAGKAVSLVVQPLTF